MKKIASECYENPTKRFLAEGALEVLPEWIKQIRAKRVLFVLGARSFRESEAFSRLKTKLSNIQVLESPAVPENPSISFVEDFCERFRAADIQAVVGAGGGSVIDAAKIVSVLLRAPQGLLVQRIAAGEGDFEARLPLAVVSTTSGSGSEMTPYVSLQTADHKKITVKDRLLFPDLALVDPLLTQSLPAKVTASTGFDALSQAIEAFWSINHTPFSDTHALRGASMAVRHLAAAVKRPNDSQARFGMAFASSEAGLAIAHTATTAVHAVSYPITTFFGVPHGHACALTLAEFIRFNESVMRDARYQELWNALGSRSAGDAAAVVEKLMNEVGLERNLSLLGIDVEGVEKILQNGFRPDRVHNNPRELTRDSLRYILQRVY